MVRNWWVSGLVGVGSRGPTQGCLGLPLLDTTMGQTNRGKRRGNSRRWGNSPIETKMSCRYRRCNIRNSFFVTGGRTGRSMRHTSTNKAGGGIPSHQVMTFGAGQGLSARFPAAVACFEDDLDALLAIHRVPVRHRIRVRTTNLAERSFVEERRRTKVISRFPDERSAMKVVFACMIRAADRFFRVSISDLERHRSIVGGMPSSCDLDQRR